MKKLFLIFTAVGFLAACNSNKKSTSAGVSSQGTLVNAGANSNNVSRINEESANKHAIPKTHLDSLMENSGSSERYNHRDGNFKGATGAGTGGSYAGAGYAQARYKKKSKPKVRREFDAPVEQEPLTRKTIEPAELNNGATGVTITGDSTNLNNELTDSENPLDSTSFSKKDSTNLNSGW